MSEHWCKDCKNDGDNRCKFTGALHTSGIMCPSFGPKEVREMSNNVGTGKTTFVSYPEGVKMFKIGDKVRVTADTNRLHELCLAGLSLEGVEGKITKIISAIKCSDDDDDGNITVDFGNDHEGTWDLDEQDLELVEPEWKDSGGTGPPIRTSGTGTMTLERFDALVDYIVEQRIKAVMCAKSAEYAQGTNKLHNFDRAGEMRGITSMEALRGMKLKHEVSIQDMLDGLTQGKVYPRELWEEKLTDNINYQILQWAILARDNGWNRTAPIEGGY